MKVSPRQTKLRDHIPETSLAMRVHTHHGVVFTFMKKGILSLRQRGWAWRTQKPEDTETQERWVMLQIL